MPTTRSAASARVKSVWIVLTPNVLLLDLAVVAEPLRIANRFSENAGTGPRFALHYVAPSPQIASSCEVAIANLQALPATLGADADNPDWVFVVGTASERGKANSLLAPTPDRVQIVRWLQSVVAPALHAGSTQLFTVCSGALLAAQAGLLDGKRCTTHHSHTAALRAHFPAAHVLDNHIYVQDGAVATSAGVTAGLDLTLAALAQYAGVALASAVARDLVVYWRRVGSDPQDSPLLAHRNHMHAAVHRAQDAVLSEPARDWSVNALAAAAFVSVRHLRRLFTEHAGTTPLAYVQNLRVALARERMRARGESADRAAHAVGLSSARHLRDVVRRSAARGGG
jgi:transcriptional regulator GlxA family with amidase domain